MADVSVRPAQPDDADEIGRIQVTAWRTGYAGVLPEAVLDSLDADAIASQWRSSISAPPSPAHHVLIAAEGEWRVGLAAFAPETEAQDGDPDVEQTVSIGLLVVEPRWGRRGHGSRLLAAVVDLARADGAVRAVAWVPAADTASLELYRSAGWATDGYQRSLDTGAGTVSELRLHTDLTADGAAAASS